MGFAFGLLGGILLVGAAAYVFTFHYLPDVLTPPVPDKIEPPTDARVWQCWCGCGCRVQTQFDVCPACEHGLHLVEDEHEVEGHPSNVLQ